MCSKSKSFPVSASFSLRSVVAATFRLRKRKLKLAPTMYAYKVLATTALLIACALELFGASSTPINRGFLQSNLNGNGFAITNLGSITSSNFVGNGAGLTNLPTTSTLIVSNTITTNAIGTNLFWDATNKRLGVGSSNTLAKLNVFGDTGQASGLRIGTGTFTSGQNIQIFQSATDSYLTFGQSLGGSSFYIGNGPDGGTTKYATFTDAGGISFLSSRLSLPSSGGVAIGSGSVAASALLDVVSTTKGSLFPRMTTTQQNAISSPATGLWIYNTDSNLFSFYNGSSWNAVGSGGGGGSGTVTSVAQSVPVQFAVSGSPVTTSGTLAITLTNSTGVSTSPIVLQTNATVSGITLTGVTTNAAVGASKIVGTTSASAETGLSITGSGSVVESTGASVTNQISISGTNSGPTFSGTGTNSGTINGGTYSGPTISAGIIASNLTYNTEALSPSGGTNFVVDFLSTRTALITATNDVFILNSTNRTADSTTERGKKLRVLASGGNRLLTLQASWLLAGTTTRTFTITNGTWFVLAVDNSGASETNCFAGGTFVQ